VNPRHSGTTIAAIQGWSWQTLVVIVVVGGLVLAARYFARSHRPAEASGPDYVGIAQIDPLWVRRDAPSLAAGMRHVHRPMLFLTRDLVGGYLVINERSLTWIPGRWATRVGARRLTIAIQSVATVIVRNKRLPGGIQPVRLEGNGWEVTLWVDDQRSFLDALTEVPTLRDRIQRKG
jgi:hypothetical protein